MFLMVARLEMSGASDAREIALHQRHPGTLDGDIGARAHGDPYVGFSQGRSVVHAVAGHGDHPTLRFQPPHDGILLLRQHFRLDLVDTELGGDGVAVVRLSPVSMTIRIPSARNAASAPGVVALIGSATATMPAGLPSTAT